MVVQTHSVRKCLGLLSQDLLALA